MESRFLSRSRKLVIFSNWFLMSESHSDISTANKLNRLPSNTLTVCISLHIQYVQLCFSCTVWFSSNSGTSGFTSVACIRHILTFNPFLNWALTYRPNLTRVYEWSFPASTKTAPEKIISCVDWGFLCLPPFFLNPLYFPLKASYVSCLCCLNVPSFCFV